MKNTSTADFISNSNRGRALNAPMSVPPPAPPDNTVAYQILQMQLTIDSHEKALARLQEVLAPVLVLSPACERERDTVPSTEMPPLANAIRIQADSLQRLGERLNVLTNSIRL